MSVDRFIRSRRTRPDVCEVDTLTAVQRVQVSRGRHRRRDERYQHGSEVRADVKQFLTDMRTGAHDGGPCAAVGELPETLGRDQLIPPGRRHCEVVPGFETRVRELHRRCRQRGEHAVGTEDGNGEDARSAFGLDRGKHWESATGLNDPNEAKNRGPVQTARTLQKVGPPAVAETVVDGLTNEIEKLSQADRAAIAAYAARATWPSGFMVYESASRADGVFVVVRGCIVLRNRVKAGRGFVPAMAGSGETFGSEGLAYHGRYATDARADGETETLHLSSAAFRAYVREQPQHALVLFGQIMRERATLLHRMRELATLGVEQRLILALLRMARSRTYTSDSGQLVLGTTQYRLLCEMVGATRESVSLVLGRLAREGLVSRDGVRYIIAPPAALEQRIDRAPDQERSLALSHADADEHADL